MMLHRIETELIVPTNGYATVVEEVCKKNLKFSFGRHQTCSCISDFMC